MDTVRPLQVVVCPGTAFVGQFAEKHASLFSDSSRIAASATAGGLVLDCTWYGDLDDAAELLARACDIPLSWSQPEIAYRYETVTIKGGIREIKLEPVMLVQVDSREDIMGTVMGELSRRRGQIKGVNDTDTGKLISADVPLAELIGYPQWLRQYNGQATATVTFSTFSEAPRNGPWPTEPQSAALRA